MELILKFNHAPFVEKSATYKIGSGYCHSLSFYFIGSNHRLLVDNLVVFAHAVKCIDDVDNNICLKDNEYDFEIDNNYIFSEVKNRGISKYGNKNIISFYVDRCRDTSLNKLVFNVFNDGRRRKMDKNKIYRLKDMFDNEAVENDLLSSSKNEKSAIENGAPDFVGDKYKEDKILENKNIIITKADKDINRIDNSSVNKVTDYGVIENGTIQAKTEIKSLVYDKFQKMIKSTSEDVIINKTMLIDVSDYKKILQNKYIGITTPDNITHRIENDYLKRIDSILDSIKSDMLLSGEKDNLAICNTWNLYSNNNNKLYTNNLEKKLSQDYYNNPILSFDNKFIEKNNSNMHINNKYVYVYKGNVNIGDYKRKLILASSSGSEIYIKNCYLLIDKNIKDLLVNSGNVEIGKYTRKIIVLDSMNTLDVINNRIDIISNKLLSKSEKDLYINSGEKFLFHPLDGAFMIDISKWFKYSRTLCEESNIFTVYNNYKDTILDNSNIFLDTVGDNYKLYILNHFLINYKDKDIYINQSVESLTKFNNKVTIYYKNYLASKYNNKIEFIYNLFIDKYSKDINIDYGQMLIEKYYHKTIDGFKSIFFEVTQRYTDTRNDYIWTNKKIRDMYKNTSIVMAHRGSNSICVDKYITASNISRNIFKYDKSVLGKVSSRGIGINTNDLLADITSKGIKEECSLMELYKVENILSLYFSETQVQRESYKFNINNNFIWFIKRSVGIMINKSYSIEASKDSRKLWFVSSIFANSPPENNRKVNIDFEYTMADKYPRNIISNNKTIMFSKISKNVSNEYEYLLANKEAYKTTSADMMKSLYRINNKLDIVDTIFELFKGFKDINYNMLTMNISKVYKDIFIDTIEDFVYRDFIKEIVFNKNILFKLSYREIDNANDYIINLKKVSRYVYENNATISLINKERCIFQDYTDKQFKVDGRTVFENNMIINFNKNYVPIFEDSKKVMLEKVNVKISNDNNKDLGVIKESYAIMTYNTYSWAYKTISGIYVNELVGSGGVVPENRRASYDTDSVWASKESYKSYVDNNGIFVNNQNRRIFKDEKIIMSSREYYKINIDFEYTGAYRINKSINIYNTFTNAIKELRDIIINKDIGWATKTNIIINSNNEFIFADKLYRDICKQNAPTFLSKMLKSIFSIDNSMFTDKLSISIGIDNSWILASKTNIDICINNTIESISKFNKELNIEYDGMLVDKNSKDIYIGSLGEFLNRDFDQDGNIRIGAAIYENVFINLGDKNTVLPYIQMLISKCIKHGNVGYSNMWVNKDMYNSMIGYENLFIGKVIHHSMIEYNNLFLHKMVHHFNDSPVGVSAYKIPRYIDCYHEYLFIYNTPRKTSVDKNYERIGKDYIDSFFDYDYECVDKITKKFNIEYSPITVDKYVKYAFVYNYLTIQKSRINANIQYENMFVNKIDKHSSFRDIVYIDKADIHSSVYDSLFMDMNKKNAKFSTEDDSTISHEDKYGKIDDVFFINQPLKHGKIDSHLSMFEYRAKGNILDNMSLYIPIHNTSIEESRFVYKPLSDSSINESANVKEIDMDMFIDDNLYVNQYIPDTYVFSTEWMNQDLKTSNLTSTEEFVDQELKELQIEYRNNFVYHISGDDGSKPDVERSGVIDELILPHKDYKYSDYLKKLILEDGSINMMYVKSFDADTGEYTVTLPIEHPLGVYADVGRDYLDVDVSILNMTIHMLKEIWKQKMFRYIAMSAQESLKDMLIELNKKIKDVYGNDISSKKEAIRCLQLFRWYSEMAILNNCEYILKFLGKEVEIDFINKDFKEMGDLIKLENMNISDNFMIEPIDHNLPCSMIITNKQKNIGSPLNMSFKLYNININSSILILDGDEKETNYKEGIHDISIDIKNKSIIRFIPNGENQSMVITNLKASNYSTDSFNIEYKGIFGETNKVMQDLLDRLIVVGEVSDDIKEKLKDVSPVAVALDKLLTYFELHHENKEKGKRLITRK